MDDVVERREGEEGGRLEVDEEAGESSSSLIVAMIKIMS